MLLKKLSLVNFKNYSEVEFLFANNVNCFVGKNGMGKTNILDAIYYLSMCKSYFNPIDSQNILYDQSFFVIQGFFTMGDGTSEVYCGVKKGVRKVFKRNKKEYPRFADHIGKYPVVMITPYDNALLTEGSEVRRKFIDIIISQYNHIYLDELINYNKAVTQRNALFKFMAINHKYDADNVAAWNAKLVLHGTVIYDIRKNFLKSFIPIMEDQFKIISGGKEIPSIVYRSDLHDNDFDSLLKKCESRDLRLQYSTCGVHKDELTFFLDGHPVKKFASQGQQKSFLIALKLAQYHFIKEKKQSKPMLLLDDFYDKLDATRGENLLNQILGEDFGQVFITDTHVTRIPKKLKSSKYENKVFTINKGVVKNA